ncbi:hypothetical protein NEDG_02059 [Nematocida displodere]|uniref:Uncharacterized protein n=1 Tax=Nematocida displodere TaxID=1805483 RepID=A0A177EKA2_9MICR|nr:hypothetical protein NEDG_02059 [Nematocida displodere]
MTAAGESERAFIRSLVQENGFYPKEAVVVIEKEYVNTADFSVRASKNGTIACVHIRMAPDTTPNTPEPKTPKAPKTPQGFGFRGCSSTYTVEVDVVKDTGAVEEIVMFCLKTALERLSVPNVQELFREARTVYGAIYEAGSPGRECSAYKSAHTRTYGVMGDEFIASPILQEIGASDALVHLTSCNGRFSSIKIEHGGVSSDALVKMLKAHLQA